MSDDAAAAAKVIVVLTHRALINLDAIHERTGYSKTDIINRALIIYGYVNATLATDNGGELWVRETRGGQLVQIKLDDEGEEK